jgi:hypothetical protein
MLDRRHSARHLMIQSAGDRLALVIFSARVKAKATSQTETEMGMSPVRSS